MRVAYSIFPSPVIVTFICLKSELHFVVVSGMVELYHVILDGTKRYNVIPIGINTGNFIYITADVLVLHRDNLFS